MDVLLARGADPCVRDANGDVPLHFASIHGHPMCAYNISKAAPSSCLVGAPASGGTLAAAVGSILL